MFDMTEKRIVLYTKERSFGLMAQIFFISFHPDKMLEFCSIHALLGDTLSKSKV